MTDSNYTHIIAILDRSGSMSSCAKDTNGGFDAFIEEQKKIEGRATVTLVQFDDQYEVVYSNKELGDVPKLNLRPRGYTALNDAIGRTIVTEGEVLSKLDEDKRPGTVIVLVLTDGGENASTEYSGAAVKKLVTEQTEKYSWVFSFIGANQDAVLTGAKLGFNPGLSMTYDTSNTLQTFDSYTSNMGNLRKSVSQGVPVAAAATRSHYTEEQRKQAVSK